MLFLREMLKLKCNLLSLALLLLMQGGCYELRGDTQHVAGEDLVSRIAEAAKALVDIETAGEIDEYYSSKELLQHHYAYSSERGLALKSSRREDGGGSGFFIDLERGYIVTNEHVVDQDEFDYLRLNLANGKTYEGELISRDKLSDIAVVAIKDKDFDRRGLGQLSFGDSDTLQLGDTIFTLGAPAGYKEVYENTVTKGIVSGLDRYSSINLGKLIQTDADLSGGNSGGPLLNMAGEVVGINTLVDMRYVGKEVIGSMGFAISSNTARQVVTELLANGVYQRGYIGVSFQRIPLAMRDHLQLDTYPELVDGYGVLVGWVQKDSPAAKDGLRAGDVIFAIGEQRIENVDEAIEAIANTRPDSELAIHVLRRDKKDIVKVKVGQRQTAEQRSPLASTEWVSGWELEVGEIRQDSNFFHRTKQDGLIVLLKPSYSGLQRGDFIVKMDDVAVNSIEQFEQYLEKRQEVLLYIERKAGQYYYVLLKKEKEDDEVLLLKEEKDGEDE